jgi:hypothetical protein
VEGAAPALYRDDKGIGKVTAILGIVYGVYLVLIGARGNAPAFLAALSQEGQFLYWLVVLLVVAALWETETGEQLAKPLAVLIAAGFLLRNWSTIAANAAALRNLPANSGGAMMG